MAGVVLEVCQPWRLLVPGWYYADLGPIQSLWPRSWDLTQFSQTELLTRIAPHAQSSAKWAGQSLGAQSSFPFYVLGGADGRQPGVDREWTGLEAGDSFWDTLPHSTH